MGSNRNRHRRAYLLGAPRRIMGAGIGQRGAPSLGGFSRQALGLGRRVLLREHRTKHGTLDCDFWNIRVRRLTPPEAVFQPWPPEPVVAVFQPQSESQ